MIFICTDHDIELFVQSWCCGPFGIDFRFRVLLCMSGVRWACGRFLLRLSVRGDSRRGFIGNLVMAAALRSSFVHLLVGCFGFGASGSHGTAGAWGSCCVTTIGDCVAVILAAGLLDGLE